MKCEHLLALAQHQSRPFGITAIFLEPGYRPAIRGNLALSPRNSVLNLSEFPQDCLAVHIWELASQSLVPFRFARMFGSFM